MIGNVYEPTNFAGRVELAANYFSRGIEGSRTLDTCFEMNDGDAVVIALMRRVQKNPNTALARNLWNRLCRQTCEGLDAQYGYPKNLPEFAAKLRDESAKVHKEMIDSMKQRASQNAAPAGCLF